MVDPKEFEKKAKNIFKNNYKKALFVIFILIMAANTLYTVPEGHQGIVKRFSKAINQKGPGLHVKIPFVDNISEIEVRTRKSSEKLTTASFEQMPVSAQVSVNWTVDKESALEIYVKYGSLQQFEDRVLDPRLKSASKDAIPKFTAERLIQDRSSAITMIEEKLKESMINFPVVLDSVQIENIGLPPKYISSIETKQTAKNLADAEKHNLAKQDLVAQQGVNTANADRDATISRADGDAYKIREEAKAEADSIRLKGLAEAEAITAKSKALKSNPLIVELTKAQTWNGQMPKMIMGDNQNLLMSLGSIDK